MALSGSLETATEEWAKAYDASEDGIGATTIVVRNRSNSTHDLYVNIPELHGGDGDEIDNYATITPGDFQPFRVDDQGLSKMYLKAPQGGAATFDFWIAARTRQR